MADQAPPAGEVDVREPDRPRRPSPMQLWALGVFVGLARWVFSAERQIFHLTPDETASLAMARWLSGGSRWSMFDFSTWRPGYAVLITPIFWLTDDPRTIVRLALLLNAAVAGVSAVILAHVVRRLTALSATGVVVVSGILTVAPSGLVASAHMWAEPLVSLCFLLSLLCMLAHVERPSAWTAVGSVVSSIAGFTAHGRLLPLVVMTTLIASGVLIARHRYHATAVVATSAAAAFSASMALTIAATRAVWDSPDRTNTAAAALRRLDQPVGMLEALIGQLWYQQVTTLGAFGIGMLVLIVRSSRQSAVTPQARNARVVLALTLPLIAVSVIFMADRSRVDHAIYGRYNDAILWPVLAVGLAWVSTHAGSGIRGASRPLGLAVFGSWLSMGLLGGAVVASRSDLLRNGALVPEMIAGLIPLMSSSTVRPLPASLVSGAVLLVGIAALRTGRSARLVATGTIVVFLLVAGLRTHDTLGSRTNVYEGARYAASLHGATIPDGTQVLVRFDPTSSNVTLFDQRLFAQLYAWYLPDHDFSLEGSETDRTDALIFAPVDDATLLRTGAVRVWIDPLVGLALWREPGS